MTDPYQPLEREIAANPACLTVLAEFRQPVTIITKNRLVTRDIDLLGDWPAMGRGSFRLDHVAGPGADRPAGTAKVAPVGPSGGHRRAGRGRHPGRRDGRAGDPRPDRAQIPAIVKASAQAGPGPRAVYSSACRWPWRACSRTGWSITSPTGRTRCLADRAARRAAQRLTVRRPDERRGPSGRADRAAVPVRHCAPGLTSTAGRSRPPPSAARTRGRGNACSL